MDVLPTIRFPTLVRGGNDFYNYLCLEIPSRKEVNMPPAENRNSFPSSIISELFFNQSLKLLLVSQGQQGTERQGWDVACGVLTETHPQAVPGTEQGPGARNGTGTDTVHLRVQWPCHSWSPLSPRSPGSSRDAIWDLYALAPLSPQPASACSSHLPRVLLPCPGPP